MRKLITVPSEDGDTSWSMVVHLTDEESKKLLKAGLIAKEKFLEVDGVKTPCISLVKGK